MARISRWCGLAMVSVLSLAGCGRGPVEPARVDLVSCLSALTNAAAFVGRPLGRMALISTYDRSGQNQDWHTFQNVGESRLVQIADLKGPGCVKRIWKTNPADQWLFFFDGEPQPRIVAEGEEGLFGQQAPFLPPLCDKVSGGCYCYMPMPYAESLRIAIRIPEGREKDFYFYHINYETYPEGTEVTSFPKELSEEEEGVLQEVNRGWTQTNAALQGGSVGNTSVPSVSSVVNSSASWTWLEESGPAVLTRFRLSLSFPPGTTALQRSRALRALVLRMTWDGKSEPSVLCPLGDFFCNGLWRRRFESLPLSVDADGFACRFPMPFRKSAKAEIVNDGDVPVTVTVSYEVVSDEEFLTMKGMKGLKVGPQGGPSQNSSSLHELHALHGIKSSPLRYFHASWHSGQTLRAPFQVLNAKGRGHYVGCYLISLGMDGTWNNLEGDETIRVDGEPFPSWHGTGLEDYFNGAWYYYGLFDLPLHGLLEKASMRTAQYRFHAHDAPAFDKDIAVAFEFGAANASQGYMSSAAYWYQDRPRPAGSAIPAMEQRVPPLDRVGVVTIMPMLFELERIGRLDEARERCDVFAEMLKGSSEGAMLQLRSAAYAERLDGFAAAAPIYRAFVEKLPNTPHAKQAESLLWFHESDTNALLGAHVNGRYRLFFDGELVGEGDNPHDIDVFKVSAGPGQHEIAVEATPSRPEGWVAVYLRAYGTNVAMDLTWEYTRREPVNWPSTGDGGVRWERLSGYDFFLPNMAFWAYAPNAYVGMQSGRQDVRVWNTWHTENPPKTAYMRKRFTVPDSR
jgi:hypothetical protein